MENKIHSLRAIMLIMNNYGSKDLVEVNMIKLNQLKPHQMVDQLL